MHEDRYNDIKQKIKSSFEIIDERTEKDDQRREEIEITEFISPLGKLKVEWITRPKVLDKKTFYSNRIGSDVKVDIVYAEDEFTHTFKVYKEDEVTGDWQEISPEAFV